MLSAQLRTGSAPERLIYKEAARSRPGGLHLLMVRPEQWRPTDRRMAMVWIHGGGWTTGSPEWFLPQCRYLAMHGAVAFSIEYQLIAPPIGTGATIPQQGATLADCIADCKSAVRYIRQHAATLGVDPARIVTGGDSAGGYLAACLGTLRDFEPPGESVDVSSMADATIVCGGIFDLTTQWRRYVPDHPLAGEMPGGNPGGDEDAWWAMRARRLSPIFRLAPNLPPALVLHGGRDDVASPQDAERFCKASRQLGNHAELKIYPHLSHAFILFDHATPEQDVMYGLEDTVTFLQGIGFLGNP